MVGPGEIGQELERGVEPEGIRADQTAGEQLQPQIGVVDVDGAIAQPGDPRVHRDDLDLAGRVGPQQCDDLITQ